MIRKSKCLGLLATLLFAAGSGCEKSPYESTLPHPATNNFAILKPKPVTLFQLHWVGVNQILAGTNSPSLKTIWELPETRNLKAQTLERFAAMLSGGKLMTNPTLMVQGKEVTNAMPLRPILEDLVDHESFWEMRQNSGAPAELAMAVRIGEDRFRLWQSNLVTEFGTTHEAGVPAVTNLFRWPWTNLIIAGKMQGLRMLELRKAGDWVVVGLSTQTNNVAYEFAERISRGEAPGIVSATNSWLAAEIDPARMNNALGLGVELPPDLPVVSVTASAEGDSLRTQAQLNFPEALPKPAAWNIPTLLIHDPLVSFTAVQGLKHWLSSLEAIKCLGTGSVPDQIYAWSQSGSPFSGYYAAPASSNFVRAVTVKLLRDANPWMDTNGLGRFERATNFNGVFWDGLNIITPYLKMVQTPVGDFAFAGLEMDANTNQPMPADLLQTLVARTNLVAYEWEFTGQRLEQWLYSGQFFRYAFRKAQVPPKSAAFAWLVVLAHHLGNTVTTVVQTGPNQLSFGRNSGIGLSAAELDWLADWLESPEFPRVLNTFAGRPEPLPLKHLNHARTIPTNSAPAAQH